MSLKSSCRCGRRPQWGASQDARIPGRQSRQRHIRPMYSFRSFARNTSAPRLNCCARPCSRRECVATAARSVSSDTTRSRSMSFGSGRSVTIEPKRLIVRTPGIWQAARKKYPAASRSSRRWPERAVLGIAPLALRPCVFARLHVSAYPPALTIPPRRSGRVPCWRFVLRRLALLSPDRFRRRRFTKSARGPLSSDTSRRAS